MSVFTIKSTNGFYAKFHTPQIGNDGWLNEYCITIHSNDMEATRKVYNHPSGQNPHDFLELLAEDWKGWDDDKQWSAMEGEMGLVATHDKKGIVALKIEITNEYFAPCWSASITLPIDAGVLQAVANEAKLFFYPKQKVESQ